MSDRTAPKPTEAISRNPANGEVIERFPDQSEAEIQRLLEHAVAATAVRRGTPIAARAEVYRALDGILQQKQDHISATITAETGKITANAGQICLNAKRFILEAPIAERFTTAFVAAARRIRTGDPLDPDTNMGPIARADLRDGIHDQVTRSVARGETVPVGGKPVDGPGFFYEPTILSDVSPGMAAFDEEIFGPVAAVSVARDVDQAVDLANTSDYGLSGNLWTQNLARAGGIARRLETGGVFVNGFTASNARIPVGGVKISGYGRELSHSGIREFANAQAVWIEQV